MRRVLERLFTRWRTPPSEGRIFISGTGRAGTSFLVELLSELGLDTGFRMQGGALTPAVTWGDLKTQEMANAAGEGKAGAHAYFDTARAGFERDIFDPVGPQIVKNPYLCDHVDDVLAAGIEIGHVIIPVRDIRQSAASRKFVQQATTGKDDGAPVAGGLWGTESGSDQETVLREKLTRLIEALVRNDIPITFLAFPRFATDPDYTFDKLRFLLGNRSRAEFGRAFAARSQPGLIHEFRDGD